MEPPIASPWMVSVISGRFALERQHWNDGRVDVEPRDVGAEAAELILLFNREVGLGDDPHVQLQPLDERQLAVAERAVRTRVIDRRDGVGGECAATPWATHAVMHTATENRIRRMEFSVGRKRCRGSISKSSPIVDGPGTPVA